MTANEKRPRLPRRLPPIAAPNLPTASTSATTEAVDFASLRLPQDFSGTEEAKDVTIRIRRPANEWFIRTHPEDHYWFKTRLLEFKETGEYYLVAKELQERLIEEPLLVDKVLIPTISTFGSIILWPVKPPNAGWADSWNASAHKLAVQARSSWLRVFSCRAKGCYTAVIAPANVQGARWPSTSIDEMLQVAFRDKYIDSYDHPRLRRLRGEE